jgi:hypothetical protein
MKKHTLKVELAIAEAMLKEAEALQATGTEHFEMVKVRIGLELEVENLKAKIAEQK